MPNLLYSLKNTWEATNPHSGRTEQVDGIQAIPSKDLSFVSSNRLDLYMDVEWTFIKLKPAQ